MTDNREPQPPVMQPGEYVVDIGIVRKVRAALAYDFLARFAPEHEKDVEPRKGYPYSAYASGGLSDKCWHGCLRCAVLRVFAAMGVEGVE